LKNESKEFLDLCFVLWIFQSYLPTSYKKYVSSQEDSKFADPIWQDAKLTPKRRSPFFGPFLRFGQAIVDAIFVQKISNFW
jgi:hypothetical protein